MRTPAAEFGHHQKSVKTEKSFTIRRLFGLASQTTRRTAGRLSFQYRAVTTTVTTTASSTMSTMKYARKRYLITPEEYGKVKKTSQEDSPFPSNRIPHPDVEKAREASENASSILGSHSLTEFDKALLHAQEFQKYLHHLRQALTVPKVEAYLGTEGSSKQRRNPTPPHPPTSPPSAPPTSLPPPSPPPPSSYSALSPPAAVSTPSLIAVTPFRRSGKKRRKQKSQGLPTPPPSIGNTPHGDGGEQESTITSTPRKAPSPYSTHQLIQDTAPEDRQKAKYVLEALKREGKPFSWNSKTGAMRLDGRYDRHSNVKAILADAVADKRHLSTPEQFASVMRILQQ